MRSLTLGRLLLLAVAGAGTIALLVLWLFLGRARASILASAERQRMAAAEGVEARIRAELGRAQRALEHIARNVRAGAIDADDPAAVEAALYAQLADEPRLEEVTFTRATRERFAADGAAVVEPEPRWQVAVFRRRDGGLTTRITKRGETGFAAWSRDRSPGAPFAGATLAETGPAPDPTTDLTFVGVVDRESRGRAIWSDLHRANLDRMLPVAEQRLVLSVQRSVDGTGGAFAGVARVALISDDLDAIARAPSSADPDDPTRVALLAAAAGPPTRAHLVARVDPSDRLEIVDDALRFTSNRAPPELRALLASAAVAGLDPEHPNGSALVSVDGTPYDATMKELSLGGGGTAGWFVAVLAPEAHYVRELVSFRNLFIAAFAIALGVVLSASTGAIVGVRRGLRRIAATATRMRAFDFGPSHDDSAFRELSEVMDGLERGKTVVRAMQKYVPVDLVRRLYDDNAEPKLGGALQDLTLMFTDIQGFTTLAEKLPPDQLAARLGDYLEAMTTAVEATGGTIDKFIGDAVMAFWNAPRPVDEPAKAACRAALACMHAADRLYASAAWKGLPPLVTRFGIHAARVMVGNFGAPTRLSYTALGDGVNTAARLEPLCKQYGVVALVSESIVVAAGDAFVFRRIDRVAVKGRTQGVDVYELLGAAGDANARLEVARRYEAAFDAYLARDFTGALRDLAAIAADDPPSAVLLARCKELADDPPPADWGGVHVARSK